MGKCPNYCSQNNMWTSLHNKRKFEEHIRIRLKVIALCITLSYPHSWLITKCLTRVHVRVGVSRVEQKLLIHPKQLCSSPVSWVRVAQYLVFCVVLYRPLFVYCCFFFLKITLSVLRFAISDLHFHIFKLLFHSIIFLGTCLIYLSLRSSI